MKRIGAFICLIVMAVSMLAPACFAEKATQDDKANYKLVKTTPNDGEQNVSVENLSVKLYFDTAMIPKTKQAKAANAKQFKLTDAKGKKIPIKVYYSHKEEGLMMVVSDVIDSKIKIQGNCKYKLSIGKNLRAADGTKLGVDKELNFKTLDQAGSTKIYMIMMGVMIVGMIFFTSRSAKKAMEKEKENGTNSTTVNPYKEAKRTGKSVEEIVAQDQKRKAKQAEAAAKKKAHEQEIIEEELAKIKSESNKRVAGPKPISATGSEYKVKVVKSKPEHKSTNPKNQTGKQKNSKNKGKKKK